MSNRATEPALDEIQWRSPPIAQEMQGVHTNSVLHYFARSPFFDPTSNNAVLVSQFAHNPRMVYIVATREEMEKRLRTMSGLEFMVAQEPADVDSSYCWVIRKQTRRKRAEQEDELTIHATYFVVGENIYMAPTVADVVGNRLLTVFNSLNNFLSKASTLPHFTPSQGHTYMSSQAANRARPSESAQMSKEGTPMPDATISGKKSLAMGSGNTAFLESRLLEESFLKTLQYGDEYMDENPITGQPGDFHFTSTGRNATKVAVPPSKTPAQPTKTAAASPPSPEVITTSLPLARKKSMGDKSPKTPGLPKPKRRKSKAVTTPGGLNAG